MSADVRNVIIIGSGPAGYTAAIYAARANLQPLVFEGSVTAGGALMTTTEVENFPGFPDGIMGPALMDDLRKQAERFGAELVTDDVDRRRPDRRRQDRHRHRRHDTYQAKAVILAMGSGYRKLGLPDEDALSGHGVSWCATCDGFFFRDQHIAVVGGGDSAVEEATFLTRFGSKVTLVHRRDELRASKIMAERAFANDKIEFAWNSEVDEIVGDDKLEGVVLRDTETGETPAARRDRRCSSRSATTRARSWSAARSTSTTRATCSSRAVRTRTNLTGVFAAGDLVDHTYRQAVTAAGTGCAAALDAERYLADTRATAACTARAAEAVGAPANVPRTSRRRPGPAVRPPRDAHARPVPPPLHRTGESMSNLPAVTDADFEPTVLESDKPVLVDFWAEWCGPCRQVDPILDEIAGEHGEAMNFVKMNVDENPVTPANYRVTGIPAINVYKGGELVKSIVGAQPKAAILRQLDEYLGATA